MDKTNSGIGVVLALVFGVPLVTLVATWHQMGNTGGDSVIRATAVQQPPAPAQAAAEPNQQGQPGVPASQASPASGANPAAPPSSGGQSAPRPQAAQPEPGRSAQDFTAFRPPWQDALEKADPKAGEQLASAGRPQGGVQACVACHGQQGVSPAGGNFPNLAGLKAEYLAKQLTDYHDGQRNHPLMGMIAKGLTPEEIGQLARYYAALPAPAVQAATGPESARTLDAVGDNGRALPACANCHGLQGRGEGPLLPRLAGQPKGYFIDQMNAFRGGQRANDDVGVMRAFAQRLTAEEIEALGAYYAGAARPQ